MSSRSFSLLLPSVIVASLMMTGCSRDLVVPQQQAQPDQTLPRTAKDPTAAYQKMFQTFGLAARSHQLADLIPFISRRLRADLVQTLRQHRQRFWKHIDRIIRGIQSGLTVDPPVRRSDGRLDLPLRFGNGDGIRPIIIIENGQPRIDRF